MSLISTPLAAHLARRFTKAFCSTAWRPCPISEPAQVAGTAALVSVAAWAVFWARVQETGTFSASRARNERTSLRIGLSISSSNGRRYRSEERRVGKEGRCEGSPYGEKNN